MNYLYKIFAIQINDDIENRREIYTENALRPVWYDIADFRSTI